jgi:hypothetical protein
MSAIDWALYTEQAVGKGAPALADVINRPLREVLTISGANPDANFVGFVLQGGPFVGALTGNASTATALSSTRTFAITGDVAGSATADLTSGLAINVALAGGVVSNVNVANGAAITYAKLSLAGSILGADLSPTANIPDSKLAQLTTANKVANSATTATSANTASTIVLRDGSGGFSAGAITATSVSGDGSALTSLAAGAIATGTLGAGRLAGTYVGITGVGTLAAGVWNATVIGPTFGGTGQIAIALGDLLYGSAANTWSRLGGNATTTRKLLLQVGDGTNPIAPSWSTLTAADIGAGTFTGAFTFAGLVALQGATTTLGVNATGSNVVASSVTITAPTSTGTGTAATISFKVGHATTSGTTSQTLESILVLQDRLATFPRGLQVTGAPSSDDTETNLPPSIVCATHHVGLALVCGAGEIDDFLLEGSGTFPGNYIMRVPTGTIGVEFFGAVTIDGAALFVDGASVANGLVVTNGGASISGNSTVSGTLTTTGALHTFGITFTGAGGGFTAGSIWADTVTGMAFWASAGSAFDFLFLNSALATVFSVAHNSQAVSFAGGITVAGAADAASYKVGGVAGASYSGVPHTITVVNGLVTAIS